MINTDQSSLDNKMDPFLWIAVLSLGFAIALAKLNIYMGTQVYYLDYLSLFNVMTIAIFVSASTAIILSMVGLWKVRFKSIPLALMSLASSAFLILMFMVG